MRKPLEKIPNLPYKEGISVCVGINLIFFLAIVFLQKRLPPEVPLFYGLAEGEEQLVPRLLLSLPNLIALIIILINTGLTLLTTNLFVKKILIMASVTATFLASITCLKIFFLVGSL